MAKPRANYSKAARKQMKADNSFRKMQERTKRMEIKHATKRVNKRAETIKAAGSALAQALTPTTTSIAGSNVAGSIMNSKTQSDISKLINPTYQATQSNAEEEERDKVYEVK